MGLSDRAWELEGDLRRPTLRASAALGRADLHQDRGDQAGGVRSVGAAWGAPESS